MRRHHPGDAPGFRQFAQGLKNAKAALLVRNKANNSVFVMFAHVQIGCALGYARGATHIAVTCRQMYHMVRFLPNSHFCPDSSSVRVIPATKSMQVWAVRLISQIAQLAEEGSRAPPAQPYESTDLATFAVTPWAQLCSA